MSYAGFSASVTGESPFKLLSQISFGKDGKPGQAPLLQQQQQQSQQKQYLYQHISQLQQSSSQQQRLTSSWSFVWCGLVMTAMLAAGAAFAPLSSPLQAGSRFAPQNQQQQHGTLLMQQAPPTARVIKCQVQQGSTLVSSFCDVDVSYDSTTQQHVTIWRQAVMAAGLAQPAAPADAAGLDDGSSDGLSVGQQGHNDSTPYNGRHHLRLRLRRQQHRRLLRLV